VAVDADARVWVLALGRGPDGHDAWALQRDGAHAVLAAPDGSPLAARSLARDDARGIVVLAQGDGECWLLGHP
jgi:hypothetical protein